MVHCIDAESTIYTCTSDSVTYSMNWTKTEVNTETGVNANDESDETMAQSDLTKWQWLVFVSILSLTLNSSFQFAVSRSHWMLISSAKWWQLYVGWIWRQCIFHCHRDAWYFIKHVQSIKRQRTREFMHRQST